MRQMLYLIGKLHPLMAWKSFLLVLLLAVGSVAALNHRWGSMPVLGSFLSPQEGFWQNAEPVLDSYGGHLQLPGIRDPVQVWFDQRMVPHLFAQNDHDLYYAQGYLTARFRLWQMETQVRAAAGRLSEILGPKLVAYDRLQRRKGMVEAARSSLKLMMQQPDVQQELLAYTDGVNAYIASIHSRQLPLEYKLLDYRPEPWTPLKCALLVTFMADDLTGGVPDLENSRARGLLSASQFAQVYPQIPDSLFPIVPAGTKFPKASVALPAAPADSTWMLPSRQVTYSFTKPDPDNGSNNWALAPSRTVDGHSLLASDPHLHLSLPSLWFEIQLSSPGQEVYGVSLPGAPGVVIGFNHAMAWGITNAQRDVKDFYQIRFRDASLTSYWFNGRWKRSSRRIERIGVRGSAPVLDTVVTTVFGPLVFQPSFPDSLAPGAYLAMHWAAADPSDELMTFYLLNRARSFEDFRHALEFFDCPGQNFAYADSSGRIALIQEGRFPLRWKGMGQFIMPGDSAYMWMGTIPREDNPKLIDPPRGFVYSANQNPTDGTYPYVYSGDFLYFRARRIFQVISSRPRHSVQDMMRLQTDTYSTLAADALPLLARYLDTAALDAYGRKTWDRLKTWDGRYQPTSVCATVFQTVWDSLYGELWNPYLDLGHDQVAKPSNNTTLEGMLRDSALSFVPYLRKADSGSLRQAINRSFRQAMMALEQGPDSGHVDSWGLHRGTNIMHLLGLPALSRMHLRTGGVAETVNATKIDHGPSWRMIVEPGPHPVAYGVYPGGQSGNPGSRYYDNFVQAWQQGRYYPLYLMSRSDSLNQHLRARLVLQPLRP